ncbi:NUDIX domain-containing protein [Paenibacillus glacialis]|uniref:DNA mismatch repair protein MutT n=1 Tax=Paenibacillus glacialis TaxID=494026 RepID=A0A168HLR2_9BACL|nr:NUDIX domain-containing protein [Paenibacillus glacialis]OAB38314.1 DNA mismatch repair protein MutT [Paenibacillus glacialis]
MAKNIIVTGGAIIKDDRGRILLQKRSDYGDWGLPGGGMEAGETIEETMIREVKEETGLEIKEYKLSSVYTGPRMEYQYPDGNKVVFVMFLFNVIADLSNGLVEDDGTLIYNDKNNESLQLSEDIEIEKINSVQKPVFIDLKEGNIEILRN